MLANVATLTALAEAVRRVQMLGVDIYNAFRDPYHCQKLLIVTLHEDHEFKRAEAVVCDG